VAGRRLVIAAVLLCGSFASLPASAATVDAPGPTAVCHFEVHEIADPGFWAMRSNEGEWSAEPGPIRCLGVIGGRQLTPEPGTVSWRGNYESTCASGGGSGSWEVSVPTVDGRTMNLRGRFTAGWVGVAWKGRGHLGDHRVEVMGESRSEPGYLEEDCFNVAFQHFASTGRMLVS
jgi:hypothetical protein